MRTYKQFYLLSLLICLLSACNTTPVNKQAPASVTAKHEIPPPAPVKLKLTQADGWLLEEIMDSNQSLIPVDEDIRITLVFKNNELRGNNSCNLYFSSYQSNDNQLSLSNISTTLKACSEKKMQQSQTYLELLQKVASFEINGRQLILQDATGSSLLQFTVDDPATLIETDWTLQMLNTGNALVNSALINKITANFTHQGNIKGFTGCNKYGGVYDQFENQFRFMKVVAYKRQCSKPEGVMTTEQQFLKATARVRRFVISAETLTFLDDKNRKILVFVKKGEVQQ